MLRLASHKTNAKEQNTRPVIVSGEAMRFVTGSDGWKLDPSAVATTAWHEKALTALRSKAIPYGDEFGDP